MSDPLVPSYALSKRRRQKREEERKKRVASERFVNEMLVVNDPKDAEFAIIDAEIAKVLGYELCRQYPDRGWEVIANSEQGVANIYNSHVTARYGYIWRLAEIRESSFVKDIMRIGGELLDRAGLTRGKFDEVEVMELQKFVNVLDKVDMS